MIVSRTATPLTWSERVNVSLRYISRQFVPVRDIAGSDSSVVLGSVPRRRTIPGQLPTFAVHDPSNWTAYIEPEVLLRFLGFSANAAVLAAVLLSLAAPNAQAQSTSPLDPAEVRGWREDLAVLRAEMPARHANLFHVMTRAQFDSALQAIDQTLPRIARHQVIVELQKLCALVGDGHTNVSPWRDSSAVFHQLPVALYWFEDGIFVRAATDAQAALLGARVVGVGGLPVEAALARVRPLISRDNKMGLRAWAPVLLTMPEILHAVGLTADPTRATLRLETATDRREMSLSAAGRFPMFTGETDLTWMGRPGWVDARDHAPQPLWLTDPQNKYWYRYLPRARSLYCQLNAIQQKPEDSLRVFFTRALAAAESSGAEHFVLDLRLNGGGDGSWNRDIVRSLIKSRYDVPGRLVVITGRRTWSAAQMLINELENFADVVFVGEPSASRGNVYGDSKKIMLPNSHLTVRVSSLYWQQSDPRDTREFIEVNIPAPLTFADYAAGRDPALEAAERVGK